VALRITAQENEVKFLVVDDDADAYYHERSVEVASRLDDVYLQLSSENTSRDDMGDSKHNDAGESKGVIDLYKPVSDSILKPVSV